jgi:response regulator NasT
MSETLHVLIADERDERALAVKVELERMSCLVDVCAPDNLLRSVESHQPDVIIVDIDSPSRDTLESLSTINTFNPKPIVMFAEQHDTKIINEAIQAGVSAYVVDSMNPQRVKPIVDAAMARFREFQALRSELESTKRELDSKRFIDRAKAQLMKNQGLTEEKAYKTLRKMAMDRGQRMDEVAKTVIAMFDALGG